MKLTLIHLALIVIGVLMLVNLGYSVKEGMESQGYLNNDTDEDEKEEDEDDKDKYILKTQIVPPVCPKCPDVVACPNNSNGWVPSPFANRDYNSQYNISPAPGSGSGPTYEPRPMLTDFSQF